MKLHVSFEIPDLDKALSIAYQIAPCTDIMEVGTLMIYRYGSEAVKKFCTAFPDNIILADTKIVDRGKDAVNIFADTGAHWLTVMSGTSKEVIREVCSSAHNQGKKIMLDLIDASSLNQSALEAESLGADALMFRHAIEVNQPEFLEQWDMVRGNTKLPIFISAHIRRKTTESLRKIKPDGIIVSSAIVNADDPAQEAQFFKDFCQDEARTN